MRLPPHIDLQVTCDNESNLAGIIVGMDIQAGRKNPYHIYFPKTTSDGRTRITADDFRGQFEDHWEEGLMDYDGNIETASSLVQLKLFSRENMLQAIQVVRAWPLLKHERKKWQSRQDVIDYFLSCRNSEFYADPQSAEIRENKVIRFRTTKRAA